jgi:hypothetical protein
MLHIMCYRRVLVGIAGFLNRADQAVQDTKQSVTTGVMLSVVALAAAVVALVIAIWR